MESPTFDLSDPELAEPLYDFYRLDKYRPLIDALCALHRLSIAECVDMYFLKEFLCYYNHGVV